jgi:hypothetical protein
VRSKEAEERNKGKAHHEKYAAQDHETGNQQIRPKLIGLARVWGKACRAIA